MMKQSEDDGKNEMIRQDANMIRKSGKDDMET